MNLKHNKKWFFTIGSVESPSKFTLVLSKNLITLILILILLSSIFFSFKIIKIYKLNNQIIEYNSLQKENFALKSKIAEFSQTIDTIKSKLTLIESWEDQIRLKRNFKPIESGIRGMGIGGYPQLDSLSSILNGNTKYNYVLLSMRLKQIEARLDFDYKNFSKIRDNILFREDIYKSTPTIYPTYGYISSGYGYRKHPILKVRSFHYGYDIVNKKGTPIYVTADGVVTKVDLKGKTAIGVYVRIKHKFGYETYYGHLDKVFVKYGQQVKKGEQIALMGRTGRTTGSHLHYEIKRYRVSRNPVTFLNIQKDNLSIAK